MKIVAIVTKSVLCLILFLTLWERVEASEVVRNSSDSVKNDAQVRFEKAYSLYLNRNCPAALPIFEALISDADPLPEFYYAACLETSSGTVENIQQAQSIYKKLFPGVAENAAKGDAASQNRLGFMYMGGKGVEKNLKEALKWYRKAAENGNTQAQLNLSAMYTFGKVVEKDPVAAMKWLRKAAENGNPGGQDVLGAMYANGDGVEQNFGEAAKWYRKAAENGIPRAQLNLGMMYLSGKGVERDPGEAMKWLRKAAENGDSRAQGNIGAMYAYGEGVEKDPVEAEKWFRRAAENGDQQARRMLEMYEEPGNDEVSEAAATGAVSQEDLKDKLKKLNVALSFSKDATREELEGLMYGLYENVKELKVDFDLVKMARDKSFDWKTRWFLVRYISACPFKLITISDEISLYSDVLLDAREHNMVRKMAAEALMGPAETEVKARKALEKAARDKKLPGDVLRSVMVTVGAVGIDDVDVLAELMKRKPETMNDGGINLNAVRALGKSRDPRAIEMLFKMMGDAEEDSFFNVTALEEFAGIIRRDPVQMEKLRPMLTPRLLKLLDDRSRIGASRQVAARMLLRMNERKAIPMILKWVKPKEEGGGGDTGDIKWAFDILAEFKAKEVIPELQKALDNVPNDPRWEESKKIAERNGHKFPDSVPQYISLQECLKKLKEEPYNKKYVSLPWEYD